MRMRLTDLSNRHETSRIQSNNWELVLNEIILQTIEKLMETIMVKNTCWRIYKDISDRKKKQVIDKNYAELCDLIKNVLYQYEYINKCNIKMEEEKMRISEKVCISTENNDNEQNEVKE